MSLSELTIQSLDEVEIGSFNQKRIHSNVKRCTNLRETSDLIKVAPPSINLYDVIEGKLFCIPFAVQNTSTGFQRIRISSSASTYFKVTYDPTQKTAPGMQVFAKLFFQLPKAEKPNTEDEKFPFNLIPFQSSDALEYQEIIRISCASETIELPVTARVPCPDIRVNASIVEFGEITDSHSVRQNVRISNFGARTGKYRITVDSHDAINIYPNKGVIGPGRAFLNTAEDLKLPSGNYVDVVFEIDIDKWKESDSIFSTAVLSVEGFPDQSIVLKASKPQQQLVLSSSLSENRLCNFGAVYFGNVKCIEFTLENTKNDILEFSAAVENDDIEAKGKAANETFGSTSMFPANLKVLPDLGTILPHSKTNIKILYTPVLPRVLNGFKNAQVFESALSSQIEHTITANVIIQNLKFKEPIKLHLTGRAILPKIDVSMKFLQFEECSRNVEKKKSLTLTNRGELSIQCDISTPPNFKVHPRRLKLNPNDSHDVQVIFIPHQLGIAEGYIIISAFKNLKVLEKVKVIGRCIPPVKTLCVPNEGRIKLLNDPVRDSTVFLEKKYEKMLDSFHILKDCSKEENMNFMLNTNCWDATTESQRILSQKSLGLTWTRVGTREMDNTFSVQELLEQKKHKSFYVTWLRTQRIDRDNKIELLVKRKKKKLLKRDLNDHEKDCDLGFERNLEELEREPSVSKELTGNDELFLFSTVGIKLDEFGNPIHHARPSRYKSSPSNKQERDDCAIEISTSMLSAAVHFSDASLNFGFVTSTSKNERLFQVTNRLSHFVKFEFFCTKDQTEEKYWPTELDGSNPLVQVIPPRGTAIFNMHLRVCSNKEYPFARIISYSVNGTKSKSAVLEVLANISPLSLSIFPSTLAMEFSDQDLDIFLKKSIVIENKSTILCDYTWNPPEGPFQITPESGQILPGGTVRGEIIWTPIDENSKHTDTLFLNVLGGKISELNITTRLVGGKCNIYYKNEKQLELEKSTEKIQRCLNFGAMAVGDCLSQTVILKNTGKAKTAFSVDNSHEFIKSGLITITPVNGMLNPREKVSLNLTVQLNKPMKLFDLKIGIIIRGGMMIYISVNAESILPIIEMSKEIDFGKIPVGARKFLPIVVKNLGNVPSTLIADLTKFPSFELFKDEGCPNFTKLIGQEVKTSSSTDLSEALLHSSKKWRIVTEPGGNTEFNLQFSPQVCGTCNFELPIEHMFLSNSDLPILQQNTFKNFKNLQIRAEGSSPNLVFSNRILDFGCKILNRNEDSLAMYQSEVTLKNISNTCLPWTLDNSSIAAYSQISSKNSVPIFYVSPSQGKLFPEEEISLKCTFIPSCEADFEANFPLYLSPDIQLDEKIIPYVEFEMKGKGYYPSLKFSCDEVILPTVPLNVLSQAQFFVINLGYENLDISYKQPKNTPENFTVLFPNGATFQPGTNRCLVQISFISNIPISFSLTLVFSNCDSQPYKICVSGCADNCLLTTWPYFQQNNILCNSATRKDISHGNFSVLNLLPGNNYKVPDCVLSSPLNNSVVDSFVNTEEGKVFYVDLTNDIDENVTCSPLYGAADDVGVSIISNWLSENIIFSKKITNFHENFVESDGRLAFEALESMSALRVPGQKWQNISSSNDRSSLLHEQYLSLLTWLSSKGALLGGIRPEALLNCKDCITYREKIGVRKARKIIRMDKAGSHNSDSQKNTNELYPSFIQENDINWWKMQSRHAWSIVIIQSIKIFVLSKITLKSVASLLFMGMKNDKQLLEGYSNVYSEGELVLYGWMASYHEREGKEFSEKILNFESDFSDGHALLKLLQNVLPCLEDKSTKGDDSSVQTSGNVTILNRSFEMLLKFRGDMSVTPQQIFEQSSGGRNVVLFLLHLRQVLLELIPKKVIDFEVPLGGSCTKIIEIENPTNEQISYDLTLEPAGTEFKLHTSRISIEGNAKCEVAVELTKPKFRAETETRLICWCVRGNNGGSPPASSVVLLLRSKVSSVLPSDCKSVSGTCYELSTMNFDISNPFDNEASQGIDCTFTIEYNQELIELDRGLNQAASRSDKLLKSSETESVTIVPTKSSNQLNEKPEKNDMNSGRTEKNIDGDKSMTEELAKGLKEPIYIKQKVITIPFKGIGTLVVDCLPFSAGTFECMVILRNEKLGEFGVQLNVVVSLPLACKLDHTMIIPDKSYSKSVQMELKIPSKSMNLGKAIEILADRYQGENKTRARMLLSKLCAISLTEQASFPLYSVNFDSPFFIPLKNDISMYPDDLKILKAEKDLNTELSLYSIPKKAEFCPFEGKNSNANNTAVVKFFPSEVGTYICLVTVAYISHRTMDLRCFELQVEVLPQRKVTELFFRCPAGEKITQQIPIFNNSCVNWVLTTKSKLIPPFFGPHSLHVPSNESAIYQLSYIPSVPSNESSQILTFQDAKSYKRPIEIEYLLKCIAEYPLATDHVTVPCIARLTTVQQFRIQNFSEKKVVYFVETDIDGAKGEMSVCMQPLDNFVYTLEICPPYGGVYVGSLSFIPTDTTVCPIWFTVEVQSARPKEEGTVQVKTPIRTAVEVEIELSNPSSETQTFDISFEGEGLVGNNSFTLGPYKTLSYNLLYKPIQKGVFDGSVTFSNSKIGEFWYRLELIAESPSSIQIPQFSTSLGKTDKKRIIIQNPIGQDIELGAYLTNERNFSVEPSNFTILAFGNFEFNVCYTPSSIGELEKSEIILRPIRVCGDTPGEFVYEVSGVGGLPGVMDEHRLSCTLHQTTNSIIPFRNALPYSISIDVVFRENSTDSKEGNHFQLFLKKTNGIVLDAFSSIQIPLAYSPTMMQETAGCIEIRSPSKRVASDSVHARPLTWVFPIIGIPHAPLMKHAYILKTLAKKTVHQEIDLTLNGLVDINLPGEFKYAIDSCHDEYIDQSRKEWLTRQVERSFKIMPRVTLLNHISQPLQFKLAFEPLRPFVATVYLIIIQKRGATWKFEILLDAMDPIPENAILIRAPVGGSSSVCFNLCNQFKESSAFTAYFSMKNHTCFTVTPRNGTLMPFGSEGTKFIVNYTPLQYSEHYKGILIVCTEDVMWSFEVTGGFPVLKSVENVVCKVDSNSKKSKKFNKK